MSDFKYPSGFVDELQKLDGRIEVLGPPPVKCPQCREGTMLSSSTGRTLRCSNHPTCGGTGSKSVSSCSMGYILVESGKAGCLNPTCGSAPKVCPSCGRGVLLQRKGKYGSFFGCSRYWSEPPCSHTVAEISLQAGRASLSVGPVVPDRIVIENFGHHRTIQHDRRPAELRDLATKSDSEGLNTTHLGQSQRTTYSERS